jgi:hypothetical protein
MKRLLLLFSVIVFQVAPGFASSNDHYIVHREEGNFCIATRRAMVSILSDTGDYKGVTRAVGDLQSDLQRVTGRKPCIITSEEGAGKRLIITGTIGRSTVIDRLVKDGKINPDQVINRWEAFLMQVVQKPLPGVEEALVIAGSDMRGTVYGIYDLSEQIGVSPWYWWADVVPRKQQVLAVAHDFSKADRPAVKYRGIFINDEAPALEGWMKKFTGGKFNHIFYGKLFELILRLKGNYLWPAMWGKSFCMDDPENPRLAAEYGIVMGTSHHEPMMRAQAEWTRTGRGQWNYTTNKDALLKFWEGGIERSKAYENIITIGMRGDGDEPMNPDNTLESNISLMQQIVADQQQLIAKHINADVSQVPQLWALYKEVQDYYEHGMTVPDYVTLLWCDDNWGNLRRLPSAAERKRSGGAGIYYHADYVGGPRCYKWINTIPATKIREQMTKAYAYGADRVWILNVGDLKPLEIPMDFFLRLAWNPAKWNDGNVNEYTREWVSRQFGAPHADEIALILDKYTKYNGWIKPELLSPQTFSQVHYREADRVMKLWKELSDKANRLYRMTEKPLKDAFFELVQYPAQASYIVNAMYYNVAKNHLYASQGRISANVYADKARMLFAEDSLLTLRYHKQIAGGKWDGMMNQPHIGYAGWRDPAYNQMPRLSYVKPSPDESTGVSVEGDTAACTADKPLSLSTFCRYGAQERYIEIFAKQNKIQPFTVEASAGWIVLSQRRGSTGRETRVKISVDWNKVPQDAKAEGRVIVKSGNRKFTVLVSFNNQQPPAGETVKGFVEADGYVAMEAEHFSANIPAGNVRWQRIPDYGRTLSSMMPLPVTAGSFPDPAHAPVLEYGCFLFTTGEVTVNTLIAPTLNCLPDADMRFAVAIDDQKPQVVEIPRISINGSRDNQTWSESVVNNIRICPTRHSIGHAGYHTIRIYMIDPDVVIQRIVVDTGGLQPSFFYPPESRLVNAPLPE